MFGQPSSRWNSPGSISSVAEKRLLAIASRVKSGSGGCVPGLPP
jgi:hypothetical protein